MPQDLCEKVVPHLENEKGHIKVYINGLGGIFPRMLCGNFLASSKTGANLNEVSEMQFTHTNFDFSIVEQPDAGSSSGYYNQPSVPAGYGIVYPVETTKEILIGRKNYVSNSIHHIEIDSMSQLGVSANNTNLPSRFVTAAVAKWRGGNPRK